MSLRSKYFVREKMEKREIKRECKQIIKRTTQPTHTKENTLISHISVFFLKSSVLIEKETNPDAMRTKRKDPNQREVNKWSIN
jgi:hypothetical protein